MAVRFDPGSGRVVASASADGQVFITTCYDENLDKGHSATGPFASVDTDADQLYKFSSNAWINTLSFSPSGEQLAFATHDCELHFVRFTAEMVAAKEKPKPEKIIYRGNPILNGLFLDENSYVGCGYDNVPLLFKRSAGGWAFSKSLDAGINTKKPAKIGKDAFGVTSVFFDGQKLKEDVAIGAKETKH